MLECTATFQLRNINMKPSDSNLGVAEVQVTDQDGKCAESTACMTGGRLLLVLSMFKKNLTSNSS